ncbi:MAG: lipid A biosynthesis acyltransferase [Acidobacteria bacterium OLB17]|nr:MAG: lipid A biosynthesis acyltransferase [Acidobacteria bacterium OLB17]MCZ2390373.1 lysophospholipid acyltransferase family protein [Acidobacteriota bacterium]
MAKKTTFQVWAEYLPVRGLLGILAILPRRVAVNIGIFLARVFYLLTGGRKDVALKNLTIAFPEKDDDERLALLKASFANLGRVLGEFSQFEKLTRAELDEMVEFEFEDPAFVSSPERQHIDAEREKGRGMILVGPHLGNWEIGVFAYSAAREPLTYLARPLDNPKIEGLVARLRSRFGNRSIDKTNSVSAAFEVLRSGGILGALPDVNMHPKDGIFVPFFGLEACTTRGLAMLAMRTNALIMPMCCVWDAAKGKYVVRYGSVIEPAEAPVADRNAEIYRLTAETAAAMESFIRMAPDQWIWTHKRWKTRPPGEAPIY